MVYFAKSALNIAKSINADIAEYTKPPDEGYLAESDQIIPRSYFNNTKGYIEKIANQINGCYENGWNDACAVMMRRLCEILIIEVYESKGLSEQIKDGNGNYINLDALINKITNEKSWTLNKFTKQSLHKIAEAGNLSAHSIRFNAHRSDIELHMSGLRVILQDLLILSEIKK